MARNRYKSGFTLLLSIAIASISVYFAMFNYKFSKILNISSYEIEFDPDLVGNSTMPED